MSKQRNPNGMGSYKLRKDGRIQWTQKKDGKPRTLYGRTPKELQEKVKKVADLPVATSKLRVAEWNDKWLEVYVKPLKKKATYNQYETLVRVHINTVIGHRYISGLKPFDIQHVIAEMNKKGLSTKTMKETRGVMMRAFNKAVDDKLIPASPVIKIEIPQKQAKPRKVLSLEELSKLFKTMENSRWIWSIKLMLVTGLRRGELLALKWTSIDFKHRRLIVDESNSITGLGDTKSAKEHYVPLSVKAIEYINEQKAQLEKEFNPSLHNEELIKNALVFPGVHGKMIRPDSFYTMLSRFAKKAGIKASPHMLRHSFVFYTRGSISIKDLQNILGHDAKTTTEDIYGNILNENFTDTANRIDDVFDKVNEEVEKIERQKTVKKEMGVIVPFKKKA